MAYLTKVDAWKKHSICIHCFVFLCSPVKFKRYNMSIEHSFPNISDYFVMLNFFFLVAIVQNIL